MKAMVTLDSQLVKVPHSVQEFATAYLNVKRDDDVDAETVLEKYVSDSSVDSIVASIGGIRQLPEGH